LNLSGQFRIFGNVREVFSKEIVMRTLMIICVLMSLAGTAGAYIETFSGGNAGWLATTVNDSGASTYPAATWNSSGGNSGGYISGTVDNDGTRLYGLSPADASQYQNLTGLTLTTDFKLDGIVTAPEGMKVRFYIGTWTGGYNYFVSSDAFAWNPNADTAWTTHQVALLAANFLAWPNQNAGTKTFAQIVAAPEDIGLVFADGVNTFASNSMLGFAGSGTAMIDNFGTVPEPVTMALLGLGGLLLRRRMA
jgi:hypothetical protein